VTSISLHESLLASMSVARRSLTSMRAAYGASADVGLRYWAGAVRDRKTPLHLAADYARWLELVTHRDPPDWTTRNEIVHSSPLALLRRFDGGAGQGAPVLILPPQAGHHSCVVDFGPGQSQVRTALDAGLDVYALEWLGATADTKDASIEDYVDVVASAVGRIGGPVHLVGDCQGGWLATIYAGLHPEAVETLTVAGAPIDTHAGDSTIADYVRLGGGMTPYRLAVELGGGVLTGSFMLGGFVALQPETELATHLELALHLDDDAYVERYASFRNWYDHTQPIPGAFYLWAVEHLFLRNELVRGELTVGGRRLSLRAITSPLMLIGGADDHITPPAQVFAFAGLAGTDPRLVETVLVSGGHLGLFMGHESLRTAWQPLFERLALRPPGRGLRKASG
jgi:poly(3-hydroxyalkanoate) synthetase